MKLNKIIICIIVCEDNINKIYNIENTWLKLNNNNIEYYFIIDDKINFGKNELYIYIKNLEKDTHFNTIRFLNSNSFIYDFILITYLDSFVNIDNLIKYLNTIDSNELVYIGGHGDYRIANNIKFYFHSYTPGVVLCNVAACKLLDINLMVKYNKNTSFEFHNLTGIALGYYATIYNIKIINNENFHYCNWNGHPCHVNNIKTNKIICCSNMDGDNMVEYYNYLINDFKGMNILFFNGGGLGNLLFQYMAGYGLSKKYNCTVYHQKNYNYWRGDMNQYKIFEHLTFIDEKLINDKNFIDYNEKDYFYNPIQLDENISYKMFGYYQSYKYFNEYINEIRNELFFNISEKYFKIEKLYYSLKKNNIQSCLIHTRRGDYLQFKDVHPICSDDYYIKAIECIPNCQYFIFSDDNNIASWKILKNIDHIVINLTDSEEILIFMSLCDNFIIANSSLSLMAYHLRSNIDCKLVAPRIWFGINGLKYKIEDIVPPNGILI
jgi:hypothetical protein